MSEKKQYRKFRHDAKWRRPSVPRPRNLGDEWQHVSSLPGYLIQRIRITLDLLKDHDVPPEFIDALDQEFPIKIRTPDQCGIDGRDDKQLAQEAKKRCLGVLTRNHTDFFTGPLVPIETCPGIFAVDGSSDIPKIAATMGAVLKELMPHLPWNWWSQSKIKFGAKGCNLRRVEKGVLVRRRLIVDSNGRVWFCPMNED